MVITGFESTIYSCTSKFAWKYDTSIFSQTHFKVFDFCQQCSTVKISLTSISRPIVFPSMELYALLTLSSSLYNALNMPSTLEHFLSRSTCVLGICWGYLTSFHSKHSQRIESISIPRRFSIFCPINVLIVNKYHWPLMTFNAHGVPHNWVSPHRMLHLNAF